MKWKKITILLTVLNNSERSVHTFRLRVWSSRTTNGFAKTRDEADRSQSAVAWITPPGDTSHSVTNIRVFHDFNIYWLAFNLILWTMSPAFNLTLLYIGLVRGRSGVGRVCTEAIGVLRLREYCPVVRCLVSLATVLRDRWCHSTPRHLRG